MITKPLVLDLMGRCTRLLANGGGPGSNAVLDDTIALCTELLHGLGDFDEAQAELNGDELCAPAKTLPEMFNDYENAVAECVMAGPNASEIKLRIARACRSQIEALFESLHERMAAGIEPEIHGKTE